MAAPTGLLELYEGRVDGTRAELATTTVTAAPTAKRVDGVRRVYELRGEVLSMTMSMAAVGLPMQHHLGAELCRSTEDEPVPP